MTDDRGVPWTKTADLTFSGSDASGLSDLASQYLKAGPFSLDSESNEILTDLYSWAQQKTLISPRRITDYLRIH